MRHRDKKAFTLIEILIVIIIIGILASLVIVGVSQALLGARVSATKSLMATLKSATENYQLLWGDYPPTKLKIRKLNNKNNGIEALTACLASENRGGGFLKDIDQGRYINLDKDEIAQEDSEKINWFFGDNQLREIQDYFGNPLVYFHHRDYSEDLPEEIILYTTQAGDQKCLPVKSPETATFFRPGTFQIISFGPNGKFDGGELDDIILH